MCTSPARPPFCSIRYHTHHTPHTTPYHTTHHTTPLHADQAVSNHSRIATSSAAKCALRTQAVRTLLIKTLLLPPPHTHTHVCIYKFACPPPSRTLFSSCSVDGGMSSSSLIVPRYCWQRLIGTAYLPVYIQLACCWSVAEEEGFTLHTVCPLIPGSTNGVEDVIWRARQRANVVNRKPQT